MASFDFKVTAEGSSKHYTRMEAYDCVLFFGSPAILCTVPHLFCFLPSRVQISLKITTSYLSIKKGPCCQITAHL